MVEQCNEIVEQWNSIGGTVWGHSGTVRWNSVVEQWNSHGGTVWWNSGTVMVEHCGGKVEQSWWNSGTVMVEQWKSNGGTVDQ